jgi:hypothetical protein
MKHLMKEKTEARRKKFELIKEEAEERRNKIELIKEEAEERRNKPEERKRILAVLDAQLAAKEINFKDYL